MTQRDKLLFWGIGAGLFFFFVAMVSDILLPFVVALIVAYFLDPAADKMEKWGASRTVATTAIIILFFVIVTLVTILLVPLFYDQFLTFIHKTPEYVALFNTKVMPAFSDVLKKIDPDALESAREAVRDVSGYVFSFVAKLLGNVWNSGLAIVNLLSLVFITPVVTFYMLRDWDNILARLKTLLPPQHAPVIMEQIGEIDKTLAGYIRGQTNVCLLLGTFYAVMLSLVGLDFALFIGMATGILSFIPYVGVLFGFVMGLSVAFFQFGDFLHISLVAAVFITGQMIEGMFVTPKLVGDKVGLHPVWIIFGMLAGASMFGFVGILLAIPVTSVIGVLVRFALSRYMESSLYLGSKPVKSRSKAKVK